MYVFARNPQSKINLSFLLFCIAQFILNFSSYNFHVAPTYEIAYVWSLGYMSYHWGMWGIAIFVYALTEQWQKLGEKKYVLLLHLPAVLITVLYAVSLAFYPNISRQSEYWTMILNYDALLPVISDGLMAIWGLVVYVLIIRAALAFGKKTFDPLKKVQMKYILLGIFASLLVELVAVGGWFGLPTISLPFLTSSMIFAVITAVAIIRFDFLSVTASAAADSIVATMSDSILLLSPEGKITFVNDATKRLLGLSEDKILEKSVNVLLRLNEHKNVLTYLRSRLRRSNFVQDLEGEVLQAGKKIAVSVSASMIVNSRKDINRGFVCIVRNISDRKQQENRLRSSFESIRMADQQIKLEISKLQGTFEALPQGLILLNDQGQIIMINSATRSLLGWRSELVIGLPLLNIFSITTQKGDSNELKKKVSTAIEKGKQLRFTLSDSIYTVGNRRRIPISLTTAPITLDGQLVGSVVAFENVTREMEIDKAKSEFVSLAAHQLKTPLSGIKWNLELMNEKLPFMKKFDETDSIAVSYSLASSMTRLVDQFLNVSRIELGKLTVDPEMVDIVSLCREVVTEQQSTAKLKHQRFIVKMPKKKIEIKLDRVLTRIVVQNILSNAIKYTPNKGEVQLSLTKHRDFAKLVVKDTGIGIPENEQKRLFEKLFRANNAMKTGAEGNGLGLYIVRAIVKLMKGEIAFESQENKGTTFVVKIPFKGMEKREGSRSLIEVNT